MLPIVTITFNPCVDKSTSVPVLQPEKKMHCSAPTFEPGGGGLNVARALKRLGGNVLAIFPTGGYSGNFLIQLLEKEQVVTLPVAIARHTRENLIVLEQASGNQYRFGMPGSALQENEWQQCLQAIGEQESDYIVASGSLPPGVPEDIMARIARIAKSKGKKLVVDTSGPALAAALEEGVYLVKPNLGELAALTGSEATVQNASHLARTIINKGGAEIIVVSLGEEGAICITRNTSVHCIPPRVEKKSTVGAGDSMVAGIVWKLSTGRTVEEALRYGVACGTAATMNAGTELCHAVDVEQLCPLVQTIRLPGDQPLRAKNTG